MQMILVFLLIKSAVLAQTPGAPARYLAFMGGGGEPAGATTIFDDQVTNVGRFAHNNSRWNTQTAFNGGHTNTERLLTENFGNNTTNPGFTEAEYNRIISDYLRKIESGEIRSGDQILLYIGSHGGSQKTGETTHAISLSDPDDNDEGGASLLAGASVSLDTLRPLVDAASRRGVRLGILDMSCHSGATQTLANENTCVISASGPNHFSYGGGSSFAGVLTANMTSGRNLEELFLLGNEGRSDTSFPMISSPAGRAMSEEIYPMLTPFLYELNPIDRLDKLRPMIEEQVLNNTCEQASADFPRVLEFARSVDEIISRHPLPARPGKRRLSTFSELLTEYHALQVQMRTDLTSMDLPRQQQTEEICGSRPRNCAELSIGEIVHYDVNAARERMQREIQAGNGKARSYEAILDRLPAIARRQQELLRQNPNLNRYRGYYQRIADQTMDLAARVSLTYARASREIYEQRARTATGPNPCRDFVL